MFDSITAHMLQSVLGMTTPQIIDWLNPITRTPPKRSQEKTIIPLTKGGMTAIIQYGRLSLNGSLQKFYQANNLWSMDRGQVAAAIEMLQQYLCLPVSDFAIARLDIAQNIRMSHPISDYLNAFEGIDKYGRNRYSDLNDSTGIQFEQTDKAVVLYDKYVEHTKSNRKSKFSTEYPINTADGDGDDFARQAISFFEQFGRNVIRPEVRLIKNAGKQLGVETLRLRDLSTKSIWNGCAQYWLHQLMKIQPKAGIASLPEIIDSQRDLDAFLRRAGIEFVGRLKIIEMIRNAKRNGLITPSHQTRMIRRVKELSSRSELWPRRNSDLFYEFRRKVIRRALRLVKDPW